MRRRSLLVFSAAIAASGVIRPVRAASRDTLAVAIFADPLSFDPHLTGNLQGRAATRAIHDTLFTVDAQGRIAPGLVETWEQPDAKSYTLHLRQGVQFHDGTPFDASVSGPWQYRAAPDRPTSSVARDQRHGTGAGHAAIRLPLRAALSARIRAVSHCDATAAASCAGSSGGMLAFRARVGTRAMSDPTSPVVAVRDLRKHYQRSSGWLTRRKGTVRAIDGVSFTVQPGEALGLVGESGCGKSTVGKSILRLLAPSRGRIELLGTDITALSESSLRRCAGICRWSSRIRIRHSIHARPRARSLPNRSPHMDLHTARRNGSGSLPCFNGWDYGLN